MAGNIPCPRCGAHNSIIALQCVRCGELLPVTRVHDDADDAPDSTMPPDTDTPSVVMPQRPDVKPNLDLSPHIPSSSSHRGIPSPQDQYQDQYEEELARNLNRASFTLMRLGCGLGKLSCCLLWLILGVGLFFVGAILSWLGAG